LRSREQRLAILCQHSLVVGQGGVQGRGAWLDGQAQHAPQLHVEVEDGALHRQRGFLALRHGLLDL
jgi:hypothetical protein